MSSEGFTVFSSLTPGETLPPLLLGRDCQAEYRGLSLASHIQPANSVRVGQVERLAVLAAIDFRIRSPGLFGITASLLEHIRGVEPALQMSAAELALGVSLVTGALPWLLDFYFVMWELRWSGCGFARGQEKSSSLRQSAAGFTSFILLEAVSAGLQDSCKALIRVQPRSGARV
jgi:hypothetical protein